MPVGDLEACWAYIYAHRLVADLLKSKAQKLLDTLCDVKDSELREQLVDIAESSVHIAREHERLAALQERDMGKRCHCAIRETVH